MEKCKVTLANSYSQEDFFLPQHFDVIHYRALFVGSLVSR